MSPQRAYSRRGRQRWIRRWRWTAPEDWDRNGPDEWGYAFTLKGALRAQARASLSEDKETGK